MRPAAIACIILLIVAAVLWCAVWFVLYPDMARAATLGEVRMLVAVNAEREKRGLVPLRFRTSLLEAGRYHAKDMARRNLLTHISSNGWTVGQRLRAFGYTSTGTVYYKIGECIGRGYRGTVWKTPEGMVALWMGSSTHRAIILTSSFRDFGCGMRWNSTYTWRYFTADFGRRVY